MEFLNIGDTLSLASKASIQKEFFTEELDILSSSESLLLFEDIVNGNNENKLSKTNFIRIKLLTKIKQQCNFLLWKLLEVGVF